MTAVLVLGLGIGANTAIFSAVRAVILQPLPFPDPGSLYMLWESNPDGVAPNDPGTFIVVLLLLAAAALGASWLPARRAARVDPARTLQAE